MKKLYILSLSLLGLISFSQNLTLDDLISLRKKKLANLEETLTLKGWSFIKGNEPGYENLGKATFAYKQSSFEDKAESFINYIYSETSTTKRINIQMHKKDKYNLFLTRIKSLGCKLLDSKIDGGNIKKVYQGATLTFMISISTQKDDFSSTSTVYHFLILENSDYINNFTETTFEDWEIADTTAVYVPESEEIVVETKTEKPVINRNFFIGRWSNENSIFTFSDSGEFTLKFDSGGVIISNWKFINNKLYVGTEGDYAIYTIINHDTSFMSYSTSKNRTVFNAYRIGG
ncbi:hypothetical protein WFZ85_14410 [Flavobacterium sp. j3]|uniref:Uncharacterized protein n=1 Tax=Flavobacterium aureirubrum TaxID=3133147 RepID=A0ABU9N803_9FLAO